MNARARRRSNAAKAQENALRVLAEGKLLLTAGPAGEPDAATPPSPPRPPSLASRVSYSVPSYAIKRSASTLRSHATLPVWIAECAEGGERRLQLACAMPDVHYSRLLTERRQRRSRFLRVAAKCERYARRGTKLAATQSIVATMLTPHDLSGALRSALRINRSTGNYLLKEIDRSVEDRPIRGLVRRVATALVSNSARRTLVTRLERYGASLSARLNALDDRRLALRSTAARARSAWRGHEASLRRWGCGAAAMVVEEREMKWQNLIEVHGQLAARRAAVVRARADEVDAVLHTAAAMPKSRDFTWPDEFFVAVDALEGEDGEVAVLLSVCTSLAADLRCSEHALRALRPQIATRTPYERRGELIALLQRALDAVDDAGGAVWAWPCPQQAPRPRRGEGGGDDPAAAALAGHFKRFLVDRRYGSGIVLHDFKLRLSTCERELWRRGSRRKNRGTLAAKHTLGAAHERELEIAKQIPLFARELAELLAYEFALFSPDVLARLDFKLDLEERGGSGEKVKSEAGVLVAAAARITQCFAEEERWISVLSKLCESVLFSLPIAQRLAHAPFQAEVVALDTTWQRQSAWMRRLTPADVGIARNFCRNDASHSWRDVDGAERAPFADAIALFELFESSGNAPGEMVCTLMQGIDCAFEEASRHAVRREREQARELGGVVGSGSDGESGEGVGGKWTPAAAGPGGRRIRHALGAEELLPIVVFIILQAGVARINRAIRFMETFGLSSEGSGEPAYYLCTLSAAVAHVCDTPCPHDGITLLSDLEARKTITLELSGAPRDVGEQQISADICREQIVVNGTSAMLHTEGLAAFRGEVSEQMFTSEVASASPAAWRNAVLTRVLQACSRTESGGDSYDAVNELLPHDLLERYSFVICQDSHSLRKGEAAPPPPIEINTVCSGAVGSDRGEAAASASASFVVKASIITHNHYRVGEIVPTVSAEEWASMPTKIMTKIEQRLEFEYVPMMLIDSCSIMTFCKRVLTIRITSTAAVQS